MVQLQSSVKTVLKSELATFQRNHSQRDVLSPPKLEQLSCICDSLRANAFQAHLNLSALRKMLHAWYSKSDVLSRVTTSHAEKGSSEIQTVKEAWLLQNNAESSQSWKFATEAALPPGGGEAAAVAPGSKRTMEVSSNG